MNKKVALILSIFCFAGVLGIGGYAYLSLRGINIRSDDELKFKANARNSNINAIQNFKPIELSWDMVPNATSYNLYWSYEPGVTKKAGNKIANVQPPFKFNQRKQGFIYYFVFFSL